MFGHMFDDTRSRFWRSPFKQSDLATLILERTATLRIVRELDIPKSSCGSEKRSTFERV